MHVMRCITSDPHTKIKASAIFNLIPKNKLDFWSPLLTVIPQQPVTPNMPEIDHLCTFNISSTNKQYISSTPSKMCPCFFFYDILVYIKDLESHLLHLEAVLRVLQSHDMSNCLSVSWPKLVCVIWVTLSRPVDVVIYWNQINVM